MSEVAEGEIMLSSPSTVFSSGEKNNIFGNNNDVVNYDALADGRMIVRPEGSLLDVLLPSPDTMTNSSDSEKPVAICNLVSLQPFSVDGVKVEAQRGLSNNISSQEVSQYEAAFAIAMAIQHLNDSDGSIVDDLYGLNEKTPCGGGSEKGSNGVLRFVTEFVDTQSNPGLAMDKVIQIFSRNKSHDPKKDPNKRQSTLFGPCAFLGESSDLVTSETSIYTGHRGYTQATGICDQCTSVHMDDKKHYSGFVRTIPDTDSLAETFLSFLVERNLIQTKSGSTRSHDGVMAMMKRPTNMRHFDEESEDMNSGSTGRFLAVLHVNNDKHRREAASVLEATTKVDPTMWVETLSIQEDGSNIQDRIATLKGLRFGFVYAIFGNDHVDLMNEVMLEAYNQGIAGETTQTAGGLQTHNWFFSPIFEGGALAKLRFPDPSSISYVHGVEDSELKKAVMLYKAYRGSGMIWLGGAGLSNLVENDRFVAFENKLIEFRDRHMERIEAMMPHRDSKAALLRDPSFLNPLIDDRAQFSYEATIMLGLAACRKAAEQDAIDDTDADHSLLLDGNDFYDEVLHTTFQSISGDMIMLNEFGTRKANSTYLKMINFYDFEPDTGSNSTSGDLYGFKMATSDYYANGKWIPVQPFTFNDGTTETPRPASVGSANVQVVARAVCIICFIFCALAISLSLVCICWTFINRDTRVVRASQPFFLYLICVGSTVLALAIIPLSVDNSGLGYSEYTMSCTATLWLLSTGFITIFSALFAKTYRINKIMDSAKRCRRITVRVRDTLVPMLILVSCNLLILTVMTILDPVEFMRFTITEDRFGRPNDEYGACDYSSHYEYIAPLFILNAGVLVFTIYQAWRARQLSTEFAETQYIFMALLSIVLVSFIGCPILLMVATSPSATHFIGSSIIFVSCVSLQLYLFVPKYFFLKKGDSNFTGANTGSRGKYFGSNNTQTTTNLHGQNNYNLHSSLGGRSDGTGNSNDCNNDDGEVILSTKTARELAREVARLRDRLRAHENTEGSAQKPEEAPNTLFLSPTAASKITVSSSEISSSKRDSSPV